MKILLFTLRILVSVYAVGCCSDSVPGCAAIISSFNICKYSIEVAARICVNTCNLCNYGKTDPPQTANILSTIKTTSLSNNQSPTWMPIGAFQPSNNLPAFITISPASQTSLTSTNTLSYTSQQSGYGNHGPTYTPRHSVVTQNLFNKFTSTPFPMSNLVLSTQNSNSHNSMKSSDTRGPFFMTIPTSMRKTTVQYNKDTGRSTVIPSLNNIIRYTKTGVPIPITNAFGSVTSKNITTQTTLLRATTPIPTTPKPTTMTSTPAQTTKLIQTTTTPIPTTTTTIPTRKLTTTQRATQQKTSTTEKPFRCSKHSDADYVFPDERHRTCYYFYKHGARHDYAQAQCESEGTHLVHLETEIEELILNRYMEQAGASDQFWLGMENINGKWMWVGNGQVSEVNSDLWEGQHGSEFKYAYNTQPDRWKAGPVDMEYKIMCEDNM